MKPFFKGLAVGVILGLALAVFFFLRSGHLSKINADLKARYDQQAELNRIKASDFDKARARWALDRATSELAAKKAEAAAAQLTARIRASQAEAAEISAEAEKLKSKVQPAIDANPELKKYIDFILAGSVKKDAIIEQLEARDRKKEKTIGELKIQLQSWKLEAGSWREQYMSEKDLNAIGAQRIKALTVSLRIEKLKWGIKGLLIGAALPVSYFLIRGLVKKTPARPATGSTVSLWI